ncbi:hypothetical protein MVEN_00514700 [Mycena venus]|uniref:Uncharacterized protein n=1 Tax=Mycena venus TaxID=2733690 RepID=A0A8H6YN32_9AGAR|nr:hypothetical protein MVEN_00514700 [Mycena venus]
MRRFSALFLLILPFAAAQTVTTTDAAGETVVENITEDVNGIPTTIILQTLAAGAALTQTVTTTDAAGDTLIEVVTGDGLGDSVTQTIQTIPAAQVGNQGPVGQPGPTGQPGAPTPFTFTTTDANGATQQVVATFTPSFPATVSPVQTFQATVLDYSAYTASYVTGAAAAAANQQNQNGALQQSAGWWGLSLSTFIGAAGGIVLLLGV